MASLSNVGKNIGWLASSATRAAMHKGFTKSDNLGDVTGKAGAQGTAAGLVGTGLGVALSWLVGNPQGTLDPWILFSIFAPLSVINLSAAYYANQSVITRTLNVERMELAFFPWLEDLVARNINSTGPLKPEEMSSQESIFMKQSPFQHLLSIEPEIQKVLSVMTQEELSEFVKGPFEDKECFYRIYISPQQITSLWFLENAQDSDLLQGFFHACLIRTLLQKGVSVDLVLKESLSFFKDLNLKATLEAKGWETQNCHLSNKHARISLHLHEEE
jgi:hypothetical protein